MDNFTIHELALTLSFIPFTIKGNSKEAKVSKLCIPEEADENSLIWISTSKQDKENIIAKTRAKGIICDDSVRTELFPEKCFIITKDPKLAFMRIANAKFVASPKYGIHPTAVIHPEAKIAKNVYIGPFTYIGKCEIGNETIIDSGCYIHDGTVLQDHVVIHAGCKIGMSGLGHIFNEHGIPENFPQLGGVVISSNVELGANCTVLRGALSCTKINKNTKIDCNVVVGHNVNIGENTIIAANSVLGGSSQIGNNVFIGINVTIIDYIIVQDKAYLGAGTVIIENVSRNTRVIARPSLIIPPSFSDSVADTNK